MVVACLALLISLGGVGYAAIVLPPNSVGTREVKDGSLLRQDFKAGVLPKTTQQPKGTLMATVGPGARISLLFGGRRVSSLSAGTYKFAVDDRSKVDNFHITGPSVDRHSSVAGTGETSWTLQLARGTYRFRSDAHPKSLRGSFRIS
jgi:hypothetical protein